MKVFCVLFLVLLNTIGNRGDPNHGLINFETDPEDLYIVSMRDWQHCHICTGSIISPTWVLSGISCSSATHLLHGLREYANCAEIEEGKRVTVYNQWPNRSILYQVWDDFNQTVPYLFMPEFSNSSIHPTIAAAAVVGWSYNNNKSKFVMKKIDGVNITEALSNETNEEFFQSFCELGEGSPLIIDNVIYGFVKPSPSCRFYNFLGDVDDVRFQPMEMNGLLPNSSRKDGFFPIAIDGKQITIGKAPGSGSYYFTYKNSFSIVLMAVVNANFEFRAKGTVFDGSVFFNIEFYS